MGGLISGIFGSSDSAGAMGLGQHRTRRHAIDAEAFQNPFSQQDRGAALAAAGELQQRAGEQVARGREGFAGQQDARAQQAQLASALQAQMRGEGPSLAQMQLQEGTDRGIAQQAGLAASQRGISPTMAARLQGQNVASMTQQAAGDAAQLRAAEQLSAQQQLGNLAGQTRQQDLGLMSTGDQTALSQGQLSMAQQQRANQIAEQDRASNMARQQLEVQQAIGSGQIDAAAYADAAARRGNFLGGIGEGIASIFSDENKKKLLAEGNQPTQDFLRDFSQAIQGKIQSGAMPMQATAPEKAEKGSGMGGMLEGLLGGVGEAGAAKGAAVGVKGGMLAKALPFLAALSDEDKKQDTKDSSDEIKQFLEAINAHSYEYKDEVKDSPLGGEDRYVSPMAQELEKTELGKTMVMDTPEGKVVDYGRGFGTILAAQAMLNDRLEELEKKKGKK